MLIAFFDGMKRLALPFVLEANVQVSILFLIATGATLILSRSSAAVRHRIWSLVFCSLFLVPALSAVVPRWTIPVIARQVSEPIHRDMIGPSADAPLMLDDEMRSTAPLPTPTEPETVVDTASIQSISVDSRRQFDAAKWLKYFVPIIWAIGFIATIGQLLRSQLYKRRLQNNARIIEEEDWNGLLKTVMRQLGIRRRLRMYQSQDENIPVTWGVFRPLIMLPVSATNWPDQRRRYVLTHELSHIQRCDLPFQIVAHVYCALYWFNPLLWYGYWRMCTECERACDDSVVQQGGAASDYAAELVRLAKELCAGQVHAAVAITRTTKLEHRIKALFDRTISHSPLNLISRVGTLIAVVALVLLTTTMRPGSRSVAADEPGKGNQASAPAANSTAADKPTSMLTSPNPLVRILQPVPKDVRVDRSGDPIPDGMVQRLGGTRFKVPGWWREFAFAANDEWIWLKAQYAISVIHRETGRSVNQQQLRLGNGRASHLSVSGDGRRVAIDMSDDLRPDTDNQLRHRVVIISTLTTSHLQEVIWKSPRTLSSIGLSHDGQLLLTASSGDLCLWNVETGEPLYREAIQGFGDTSSAAIVRDGKSAIVVGQDFVAIWNFEQNPAITKLPVDQGTSICLARNDRMFATLGHDEVRVWDITNCNLLASLKNDQKRRFMGDFGFSFSPDSKLLAVPVASDHAIELWNVELTECVNRFHVRRPRGAIFSRNGRWLAAAGDDSVTTIIDLQTGKQVNQPSIGHEDTLWSLCFIDDESLLSSCVDARIWDLKSATQQKVLAHNVDTHLQKVAVSPDGRRLVTIGHDSIGIWDSTTGARLLTIPTGFYNTRLAQFNADGSQFVTWGGDEARLRWWNTADGTNTATFEVDLPGYQRERKPGQMPRGHIFVQALTPEKLFVVYGENLLEFDVITGEQRRKVRLDHRVWALAASTDGRWLAMAEEGRLDGGQFCVVLRDLQKLEIVRQWPVAEPGEIPSPKNEDSNVPAISRVMQGTQGIMFSSDSKHLAWCRSGHRFGIDVANIDQDSLVAKIPLERFHGRASALCVDLVI